MGMITVSITDARLIAAANAAWQETENKPATVTEYVQAALDRVAESWAETTGVDRIPVGAFVRRFPGDVMDQVNERAATDPQVAAILAQLDAVTHVRLGASTTLQGVGYLVSIGLLTQEQADAITAY